MVYSPADNAIRTTGAGITAGLKSIIQSCETPSLERIGYAIPMDDIAY